MTTSESTETLTLDPAPAQPTQDVKTLEERPPAAPARALPDEPLVVISPKRSALGLGLREVWAYRELLYFLMWRDVKVRYKQTALGVVWVVLQPLLMMVIFTLFFGNFGRIPSDGGVPYALFAYAGLLPWTFFSAAVAAGGNSMVNSASMLTKVYFPRLIVPLAAVGALTLDLAISFCVLALLMAYWGVGAGRSLLMLPALVALLVALALGAGTLMAALNVRYRDVRIALPFALQVWFFASPIIYPVTIVPEELRWLMALNPMTGVAEGFRAALYGRKAFDWAALGVSAAVAVAVLACAAFAFKRMEKEFADIV
jgi:lipopolysaccharide transport system permease protein